MKERLTAFAYLALLAGPSPVGRGATETPFVQLGTCKLGQDPQAGTEPLFFKTCLKGSAGAEGNFAAGYPEDNFWMKYARGYAGVHFTSWLAFHAKGYVRATIPLDDRVPGKEERVPEYAFLRLGNPVLSHYRLALGHVPLPFGLALTDAPETYRLLDSGDFWASPEHGGVLTLDDGVRNMLELGCGTDEARHVRKEKQGEGEGEDDDKLGRGCAVRYSRDISALEGSRLIASAYSDSENVKRYGAAFINVNRRGDSTSIEFVRRHPAPSTDFEQLLRVGFASAWRQNDRWVVQVDDERARFRRGVVSYETRFLQFFVGRFALGYKRQEARGERHEQRWTLTTGLEATL